MTKRKVEEFELEFAESKEQRINIDERSEKHTLDSDEEDSGDDERYNVMNENDIEGEEEGVSAIEGDVKITPFNMKEELEEGHFDREGHFQWDKSKEIRDNWLDNIDWVKVKTDKNYIEKSNRGLADSSDSDDETTSTFKEIETYRKIFELMQPKETIKKTLQRLGKTTARLSSIERWRRRKAGIVDKDGELIIKLTELANDILTNTGNMDVYEETYEMIQSKINKTKIKQTGGTEEELDMYSDDFDTKEKNKLGSNNSKSENLVTTKETEEKEQSKNNTEWEFKWKQVDTDVFGPYSTEQMQNWVEEGFFKNGVFVRKIGSDTNFYSSSRIDFELYL